MKPLNKFSLAFVLLIVLSLSATLIPNVLSVVPVQSSNITIPSLNSTFNPIDSNISQDALSFMKNVAGINTSKYTVQVGSMNLSAVSGVPGEEVVKYSLSSSGSQLNVDFIFRNGTLVWYTLYPIKGVPLYTQTQINAVSVAKTILANYQNFNPASLSYMPTIANLMNSVNQPSDPTNVASTSFQQTSASGNVVQEISTDGSNASIQWSYNPNGIIDNHKLMSMTLQNGGLTFFQDNWNFFTIGNANVNVPKDKAIAIAEQYAYSSYSYREEGTNQTVSNFTFANSPDQPVLASLSLEDRGNGILYPQWEMYLPLNGTYPDGVTLIQVFEWADTGQISAITAVGSGASPPSQPSGQSSAVQSTSSKPMSFEFEAIAIPMLIAATAAASYLIYKRRR